MIWMLLCIRLGIGQQALDHQSALHVPPPSHTVLSLLSCRGAEKALTLLRRALAWCGGGVMLPRACSRCARCKLLKLEKERG